MYSDLASLVLLGQNARPNRKPYSPGMRLAGELVALDPENSVAWGHIQYVVWKHPI